MYGRLTLFGGLAGGFEKELAAVKNDEGVSRGGVQAEPGNCADMVREGVQPRG